MTESLRIKTTERQEKDQYRQEKEQEDDVVTAEDYMGIQSQSGLLLQSLMEFYMSDHNHIDILKTAVCGESRISLRIIDWFVTNFSKKYYTIYVLKNRGTNSYRFKVHNEYKLKLKGYSKEMFDVFSRGPRLEMMDFITTVGQMCFFKWAIENQILEYIEANYDSILIDMNSRNSTVKRRETDDDNNKTRKKRQELSVSALKTIKKEHVHIIVKFT